MVIYWSMGNLSVDIALKKRDVLSSSNHYLSVVPQGGVGPHVLPHLWWNLDRSNLLAKTTIAKVISWVQQPCHVQTCLCGTLLFVLLMFFPLCCLFFLWDSQRVVPVSHWGLSGLRSLMFNHWSNSESTYYILCFVIRQMLAKPEVSTKVWI